MHATLTESAKRHMRQFVLDFCDAAFTRKLKSKLKSLPGDLLDLTNLSSTLSVYLVSD